MVHVPVYFDWMWDCNVTYIFYLSTVFGLLLFKGLGYSVVKKSHDLWSDWNDQVNRDAIWRQIWVNISSGNGLLPDGTKPLPEPMLTEHQWSPMTIILEQFHERCLNHQSLKSVWKLRPKISLKFPRGQWVKCSFRRVKMTPVVLLLHWF